MRNRRPPASQETWTEDEARLALEDWQQSGDTIAGFARRYGVPAWRLYHWRKRLAAAGPTQPARAALRMVPATVVIPEAAVVVRIRDGVTIEVTHASPSWVAAMVAELARSGS